MLKIIFILICLIHFRLIFSSHSLISSNLFLISLFLIFFEKRPSIVSISWSSSGFKAFKASICFIPWSPIVFICFSNALPRGEYVNFAFSFILLWLDDNISSPVRYSYLSVLPYDNADIFAASLLISYCSFSSLILSSIVMINFYILSKRFFLKHEELSDARVVSITTKEYGFAVHFL